MPRAHFLPWAAVLFTVVVWSAMPGCRPSGQATSRGYATAVPGAAPSPNATRSAGTVGAPKDVTNGAPRPTAPAGQASSDVEAALELAEKYSFLASLWVDLFDLVFEMASDPQSAVDPESAALLENGFATYLEGLNDLPATPVTEAVLRSEERALDLLADAYQGILGLGQRRSADDLRPAARLVVEAGKAHLEASNAVADFLRGLGLSPADFGL